MIKEEKNIDFYTTGKQPSEQAFAHISEWIKKDKAKKGLIQSTKLRKKTTMPDTMTASRANTAQH